LTNYFRGFPDTYDAPFGSFLAGENREQGSIQKNNGILMEIYNEMELTKNEILATIYAW
jgi:hypothetical protein